MHLNIWSNHVTHLCCMNKELDTSQPSHFSALLVLRLTTVRMKDVRSNSISKNLHHTIFEIRMIKSMSEQSHLFSIMAGKIDFLDLPNWIFPSSHFKYPPDRPSRHLCNKQCREASIKINMINKQQRNGNYITSRH